MKNYKLLIPLLCALCFVTSCNNGAKIEGTLVGAKNAKVVVAKLDVNKFNVLDTITTNAKGQYTYKVKNIEKGQPEFVYLYYKQVPIASLILQKGETCNVVSDSLGGYSVKGSKESVKMAEVVKAQNSFNSQMQKLGAKLAVAAEGSQEAKDIKAEIAKKYIEYYRSRVKYIIENPKSITCVNVLYQAVGDDMPVFSQITDAIHFRNVVDSLKTVYPNSAYVKALEAVAEKRENKMALHNKLQEANKVGFLDITLPGIQGQNISLSSLNAKVVMLYFWSTAPAQNLLNIDVLKPLYEAYHSKGFEIYAVCVDTDKANWASVVRNQHLPWVNVCDGKGAASVPINTYAVTNVPTSFLIVNGVLSTDTSVKDAASLRNFLDKNL